MPLLWLFRKRRGTESQKLEDMFPRKANTSRGWISHNQHCLQPPNEAGHPAFVALSSTTLLPGKRDFKQA
jgi:hypothetical protein